MEDQDQQQQLVERVVEWAVRWRTQEYGVVPTGASDDVLVHHTGTATSGLRDADGIRAVDAYLAALTESNDSRPAHWLNQPVTEGPKVEYDDAPEHGLPPREATGYTGFTDEEHDAISRMGTEERFARCPYPGKCMPVCAACRRERGVDIHGNPVDPEGRLPP